MVGFNIGRNNHDPPFETAVERRQDLPPPQRVVSRRQPPLEMAVGPSATWPSGQGPTASTGGAVGGSWTND
jgi:hypothetical protein